MADIEITKPSALSEDVKPADNAVAVSEEDMRDVQTLMASGPQVSWSALVAHERRTGRRTQAQKYQDVKANMLAMADPGHPDHAQWLAANAPYKRKDVQPSTVYQDAALSNLSVMYGNEEYISDLLLPSIPVPNETGVYYTYGKRDRMEQDLDDFLGNRGEANEVVETRSTGTFSCVGYGLRNFISESTIRQQDAPMNEFMDATESLAELLAFKREGRGATLLTTATSYNASNRATIAAADRWNSAGGGNPISDMQTGLAAMWQGRGPGVVKAASSLAVYNVLSRHPDILALFQYNGSSPGLASPKMIAGFLGLDDYLVGKAWQQTSEEGQTAAYSRMWSDVFIMVRVATTPSIRNAAFGYAFDYVKGNVTSEFLRRQGVLGGWSVQNTCSYDHAVVCDDCGYHITTPIS